MSASARTPAARSMAALPSGQLELPPSSHSAAGIGRLAHLVIAILAPSAEGSDVTIADSCLALAHRLAAPSPRSRANAVLAAGFAVEYLGTLRPTPPWAVLGVEYDTGAGRVDVAYRHESTGQVLFDEVKTTHVPSAQLNREWVDQAHRYAQAGAGRFAGRFLGTRLLPLGSRHLTALVTPRGRIKKLSPNPCSPLRGLR